mgnify:CR=1 FL=1
MVRISLFSAVAGLAATVSMAVSAQDYSNYVDLPETDWSVAEGTGRELIETYCTACHSVAPIVQHPGFSREGWKAEIEKMQKRYGAYVEEADVDALSSYLTTNYGTATSPHWPANATDIATD